MKKDQKAPEMRQTARTAKMSGTNIVILIDGSFVAHLRTTFQLSLVIDFLHNVIHLWILDPTAC